MVYVKLRHSLMGMRMGLMNHASSNLARITVEEVFINDYSQILPVVSPNFDFVYWLASRRAMARSSEGSSSSLSSREHCEPPLRADLARAEAVKDILAISRELSRVTAELEAQQSVAQRLSSCASTSALCLHAVTLATFWCRFKQG